MASVFIQRDSDPNSPRYGKVNGVYRRPQYAEAFESTIVLADEPITEAQAADLAEADVAADDFDLRSRDALAAEKPTPITEEVPDTHPDVLEYQAHLAALDQAGEQRNAAIAAAINRLIAP